MRGIVSLAAALALPLPPAQGTPFPFRDEVILLTFAVILSTLVIQGLSLTPLIRRLELGEDDSLEVEEAFAREEAARAALARLEALDGGAWSRREHRPAADALYPARAAGVAARAGRAGAMPRGRGPPCAGSVTRRSPRSGRP